MSESTPGLPAVMLCPSGIHNHHADKSKPVCLQRFIVYKALEGWQALLHPGSYLTSECTYVWSPAIMQLHYIDQQCPRSVPWIYLHPFYMKTVATPALGMNGRI